MPKYVLAYHGGADMPASEAEQAAIYEKWGQWFGELGDSVVDPGHPISLSKTIAADGSVSDGGGANPLTGYSIVTADDLDHAVAKAKSCPLLEAGGHVEVGEAIDM